MDDDPKWIDEMVASSFADPTIEKLCEVLFERTRVLCSLHRSGEKGVLPTMDNILNFNFQFSCRYEGENFLNSASKEERISTQHLLAGMLLLYLGGGGGGPMESFSWDKEDLEALVKSGILTRGNSTSSWMLQTNVAGSSLRGMHRQAKEGMARTASRMVTYWILLSVTRGADRWAKEKNAIWLSAFQLGSDWRAEEKDYNPRIQTVLPRRSANTEANTWPKDLNCWSGYADLNRRSGSSFKIVCVCAPAHPPTHTRERLTLSHEEVSEDLYCNWSANFIMIFVHCYVLLPIRDRIRFHMRCAHQLTVVRKDVNMQS